MTYARDHTASWDDVTEVIAAAAAAAAAAATTLIPVTSGQSVVSQSPQLSAAWPSVVGAPSA